MKRTRCSSARFLPSRTTGFRGYEQRRLRELKDRVERIYQSFSRQGFMKALGAEIESVESGKVTLTCAFAEGLTQQHGLLHGGVLASLADVACGYAALSMMPPEREVLTVEFKINFLKPANTKRLVVVGRYCSPGAR
jgi:uncharacterized protein (TIGR00369 family)